MIDFNKLRTFISIVDCGSVSAAARTLNRTQSAISQQIQILENECGFSLFETLRGGLYLTKEGKELYDSSQSSFHQIERSVGKIQGASEDLSGTIKIATNPSLGHYIIAKYVQNFKQSFPNVCVEMRLGPDEASEELLLHDEVDLAFMINFEKRERFVTTSLVDFEEYLVGTPKYLSQLKKKSASQIKLDHLKHATLIDFDRDSPNIRHWLKKNSKNYRSILASKHADYIVEDNECVKRLALLNAGLAMLPEYMIADELRRKKLVKVFPQSQPTLIGVDLALRKKKNISVLIDAFKTTVLSLP